MPVYIFKNPNREEYVEVVQKMTDDHVFIDDSGVEWERVWTAPTTSIGLEADADSAGAFVRKTAGWNTGDMWDYSKELSEKRRSKRGYAHVKNEHESAREKKINDIKKARKSRVQRRTGDE